MDSAVIGHVVIVTYDPDLVKLQAMVDVLIDSNVEIIIVDNTETELDLKWLDKVTVISMGGNHGIAAAQNVGIKHAQAQGAKIIIFFDQDSRFEKDLIVGLIEAHDSPLPCVIGPSFFDEKKKFEYPAIRIGRFGGRTKVYPSTWSSREQVNIIISSGSAINAAAFDVVGLLNEDLFIDYVDTEWCLRARAAGVPIYVSPELRMIHSVGNESLRLGLWRVPIHSAARRYYRVRNALLLLRISHVPKLLAIREVFFSFIHQSIILLRYPRLDYLRFFIKGICDGIRGRKGKIQ